MPVNYKLVKSYLPWAAVTLAVTVHLCAAQTYTTCDPRKKTCPADTGLNTYQLHTDFTSGESAFHHWKRISDTVKSTSLGASFTISEKGDSPIIKSDFYILFGYVDIKMRAATGTGIISTAIMESDDLDEIDWEQVSTYDDQIQTNYFGKGNTTSYGRAMNISISKPEEAFHTYAINWTQSKIEWILDGSVVRTLNYSDAVGGYDFPQTPMRIKIGVWAGGDPSNSQGTITWAGGKTVYSDGPFTMFVESVKIINFNPALSYIYTDKTGSYSSIKASNSTSTSNSTKASGSPSLLNSTELSSSARANTSASTSGVPDFSSFLSSFFAIFLVGFVAGMLHV